MKSMEIQSGHSELSVILQVSAVEGYPLGGVPLYTQNNGVLQSFIHRLVAKQLSQNHAASYLYSITELMISTIQTGVTLPIIVHSLNRIKVSL